MADHRALGRLGWAFSAVTAAVLLTAVLVVASRTDQPAGPGTTRLLAAATQSSTAR
jgi:hypothetical protein